MGTGGARKAPHRLRHIGARIKPALARAQAHFAHQIRPDGMNGGLGDLGVGTGSDEFGDQHVVSSLIGNEWRRQRPGVLCSCAHGERMVRRERMDEIIAPSMNVVDLQMLQHGFEAGDAFFQRHLAGRAQGVGHAVGIIGIHL